MGIRLSDIVAGPRDVALGDGVSITLMPVSYAAMKAAEATAHRKAREQIGDYFGLMGEADGDWEQQLLYQERIIGIAEELMLDGLVANYATGWDGVFENDDTPVPLNEANWRRFRNAFPWKADQVRAALHRPVDIVASEGNLSAPSPNTA